MAWQMARKCCAEPAAFCAYLVPPKAGARRKAGSTAPGGISRIASHDDVSRAGPSIRTTEERSFCFRAARVAPRKTLTLCRKGDTPCECETLRDPDEWTRKKKRNKPRSRKIRS